MAIDLGGGGGGGGVPIGGLTTLAIASATSGPTTTPIPLLAVLVKSILDETHRTTLTAP